MTTEAIAGSLFHNILSLIAKDRDLLDSATKMATTMATAMRTLDQTDPFSANLTQCASDLVRALQGVSTHAPA